MLGIGMEDHRPSLIIEGVNEAHRTMKTGGAFWPFFSSNLNIGYWLIGVFLAAMDLDLPSAVAVVFVGSIIGSLLPALLGLMGPKTGLTQMESSRFSFGKRGIVVPSIVNWINCIGWDAVNNVPSAAALVGLAVMLGLSIPFWLALAVLAGSQMIICIYGHDLVQAVQKWMGFALLATFVAMGVLAILHGAGTVTTAKHVTAQSFILGVALVASVNISWVPYASDYTRYLPRSVSSKAIFLRMFLGMFLSSIVMLGLGLLTASIVTDQTPQGITEAIRSHTGAFAPVALLIIALASIPPNALNDNTGAYSLISAGIKIPRHLSAIVASLIGFVLAVYGAGQFTQFLENLLLLVIYWVAPWGAIVLVDWLMRKEDGARFPAGWSNGATIWCVVTVGTIALFPATEFYTGPVAKALGGLDIGYYVGFAAAALWYWASLRFGRRNEPAVTP